MLSNLQNIMVYYHSPAHWEDQQQNDDQQINERQKKMENCTYRGQEYSKLVQEIQQSIKNLKAIQFRLASMMKNSFKAFKSNIRHEQTNRTLNRFFHLWRQQMKSNKIIRAIIKNRVFIQLKRNQQCIMQKNMYKVMEMTADNCYEKTLKAKVFIQWRQTLQVERKSKELQQYKMKNNFSKFKYLCEIKRDDEFAKQLATNIYKQKLMKKYFEGLAKAVKISKIQSIKSDKFGRLLIKQLKKYYKQQTLKYQTYYQKKLLSQCFLKLKYNKDVQKYDRYYNQRLLRNSFNVWIKAGDILFYQKEEEIKNEEILNEYLKRKQKIKLLYHFQKWKSQVEGRIENRKKNEIAKQYGQVKEKQFLLRKYFNAMKEFKLHTKAQRFHQTSLKSKTLLSLKLSLIKTAQKWDNLYKFVENRQKRKYFDGIKLFIKQDLIKVLKFRTQQIWNKFTFAITKNYVLSNTKATQFHSQNLKFKSLFAFKEMIILRNKINKTIILVNANMTLRRWRKGYKIREFVREREFVLMGKIFRELKLLRMNKIWSDPYLNSNNASDNF